MSRRLSIADVKAVDAYVGEARAKLPPAPSRSALEAARRLIATQMAHDKLDELREYYLDELLVGLKDPEARQSALCDMEDPIDLARYVTDQLDDGDEWDIEAEALLESVLEEFGRIVK